MVRIINSLVVDESSISVLDQWCHEPKSFQFLKILMGAYPKQHGRMSLLKIMKARCVGIESSQTSSRLKKNQNNPNRATIYKAKVPPEEK